MFGKYGMTAVMAVRGRTNGGPVYLIPETIMHLVYLVPLLFIWRTLAESGAEVEISVSQPLNYTYMNALAADLMTVNTCLSAWNFDTRSMELFTRPMPVFGQVIAKTVGEWVPMLLLAPVLGIRTLTGTLWVVPALILSVSLGFAFEFILYCVTVRLHNVSWLTYVIRSAIVSFFPGTVILFKILPFGMERWIRYQPFGSLGGAFLALYVGSADAAEILPIQLFWNIVMWTAAVFWFRRSRERMVSFGG